MLSFLSLLLSVARPSTQQKQHQQLGGDPVDVAITRRSIGGDK